MNKKQARVRRARKTRAKIAELRVPRLCIHRTPQHIYAQLVSGDSGLTLASASTVEKDIRSRLSGPSGNIEAAKVVGQVMAERALSAGVGRVAFDRSGFKYHGRVKALADAARESGLQL